jgi:hypothetical protein
MCGFVPCHTVGCGDGAGGAGVTSCAHIRACSTPSAYWLALLPRGCIAASAAPSSCTITAHGTGTSLKVPVSGAGPPQSSQRSASRTPKQNRGPFRSHSCDEIASCAASTSVSRNLARLITPSPPGSHPSRALTITPPQPRGPGRTKAALDWTKPTPRPAAHVDRLDPRIPGSRCASHSVMITASRAADVNRHELSIDNSCLPASLVAGRRYYAPQLQPVAPPIFSLVLPLTFWALSLIFLPIPIVHSRCGSCQPTR